MTAADSKPRVLDVGQCDLDHRNITQMLKNEFGAAVDRARDNAQVDHLLDFYDYDLILVNRVFDADASSGHDLISRLKSDESAADTPIMLVSNYDDAQDKAEASGAVKGFGKAALASPETIELLGSFLNRK
ncbi:MAG: transcriptional regulator [Phycisphaerae bacterium]|nr:MAG: transcriptional regulator [Phycisphaerae bacterium]